VAEATDRDWAARIAPEIIAQARREAEDEVRAKLRARMTRALLDAVDEATAPRPARTTPEPAAPAPGTGSAVWLYGVLPGDAADPDGWPGVAAGAPVRAVRRAGLCALVSDVPMPEFGTEALQQRLEDLDQVEALARAHEQVLDRAPGPVVPFRLCTIYSSDASLIAMLDGEHAALAATLERLRDAQEWGVKAYLTHRASDDAVTAGSPDSGGAYLARKREVREAAEDARRLSEEAVERIHAGLSEHAAGAVLSRPHDRRLAGREETMVLNASYLVPDERLEEFRALVAELDGRHRDDGLELELTGPWPPYHFVDVGVMT
jgi:hypothetical protein